MIFKKSGNKLIKTSLRKLFNKDDNLFIEVSEDKLPFIEDWKPKYYMLDENGNIIPDEDRIKKFLPEYQSKRLVSYIYQYYPQIKQNSDISDKLYYENILESKGYDIRTYIVEGVEKYYNGEDFNDIVNNIVDSVGCDVESVTQLLKVAIRVCWVQKCKSEYWESLKEYRDMNLPDFPDLNMY